MPFTGKNTNLVHLRSSGNLLQMLIFLYTVMKQSYYILYLLLLLKETFG